MSSDGYDNAGAGMRSEHAFSSINLLLNDLRSEVAGECIRKIEEKWHPGESVLYRHIFVDASVPYRAKKNSISIYLDTMGRKSVGSGQVEVFVLRFSDHTQEGESDSSDAKMKTVFVQEKMGSYHPECRKPA